VCCLFGKYSHRYAQSHRKDKKCKLAEEVDIQVGPAKLCVFVSVYVANVCVCALREVVNDSRGRGMGACASNTRENARPRLSKRPKGTRREERADFGMLVFLHLL